jgi:hypothetical protein
MESIKHRVTIKHLNIIQWKRRVYVCIMYVYVHTVSYHIYEKVLQML